MGASHDFVHNSNDWAKLVRTARVTTPPLPPRCPSWLPCVMPASLCTRCVWLPSTALVWLPPPHTLHPLLGCPASPHPLCVATSARCARCVWLPHAAPAVCGYPS